MNNFVGRDQLKYLDIGKRITLKWNLKKCDLMVLTGFSWL
jgi:hypothetical protein